MRSASAASILACLLAATAVSAADYPDSLVATVSLGSSSGPVGVCAAPDGGHAYAAGEFGIISAVETAGYTVSGTCYIGSELGDICITPDGQHLLACNVEENAVEVIAVEGMQHLHTVEVGADPTAIEAMPDGERVLVSCNLFQIWVIGTDGWTVEETVSVGSSPRGICAMPGGELACVARSDSYNAAVLHLDGYGTDDLFTGADTWDVCPSPEGSVAYFTVPEWDMIKAVDVQTGQVTAEVFDVGEEPLDICALPNGQHLYSSSSGTGEVFVVDAMQGTVVDSILTGSNPLGISPHPAGTEVYVVDNFLGELAVIGGGPSGVEAGGDLTGITLCASGRNPCTGLAELELGLPQPSEVSVTVFDLSGRPVARLRPGQLSSGTHRLQLELSAAGVFLCRAEAACGSACARLVNLGR